MFREFTFDSGAGLTAIPEEAVVEVMNVRNAADINMGRARHPVLELETWLGGGRRRKRRRN